MKAYKVVTIEREYASGGSLIGRMVSKKLGIPAYDHEILEYIAKEKGISPQNIAAYEENKTNSLLYSLHVISQAMQGAEPEMAYSDRLNFGEQELIRKIADHTGCIIIGRCAAYALRNRGDVLNVFITADKAYRKDRAVREYGVTEAQAEQTLQQYDRRRAAFYKEITGGNWRERSGYAMVLDSSQLGTETCADIIADTAKGHVYRSAE